MHSEVGIMFARGRRGYDNGATDILTEGRCDTYGTRDRAADDVTAFGWTSTTVYGHGSICWV